MRSLAGSLADGVLANNTSLSIYAVCVCVCVCVGVELGSVEGLKCLLYEVLANFHIHDFSTSNILHVAL